MISLKILLLFLLSTILWSFQFWKDFVSIQDTSSVGHYGPFLDHGGLPLATCMDGFRGRLHHKFP
ncbi:hypothetical protein OH77DRAFT_1523133 [Trametes cingulata]|nr:hypothetical protein OH77DRAFT_1523133 [Trametes cingulata]